MTDAHRLDLLEFYKWDIHCAKDGDWTAEGKFGITRSFKLLREALDEALKKQAEWALR
jgi:hypothetical protein